MPWMVTSAKRSFVVTVCGAAARGPRILVGAEILDEERADLGVVEPLRLHGAERLGHRLSVLRRPSLSLTMFDVTSAS